MAGDSEIKLILTAVDKASKELDKINKALGKTGDEAEKLDKKTKQSGEGLIDGFKKAHKQIIGTTAAIIGFGLAIKKAYDLGKQGAQIEFTASKFDRLSASVGTTSKVLMEDLREASRGTVSDLDLMSSATDFMALGLAKDHDEVVRLTRVAGALGMDMNQLVLTLTNMTTMRFDALGVSVDGFDAKVKKLEQSGLDAGAAFRQAFLEQAEDQIRRVGDVADTNAGKIMQFEAATKNLATAFKLSLAPSIADAAEKLTELITRSERLNDIIKEQEGIVRGTAGSYSEYAQLVLDKGVEVGKITKEQADFILALVMSNKDLTEVEWNRIPAIKAIIENMGLLDEVNWDLIDSNTYLTESGQLVVKMDKELADAEMRAIERRNALTTSTVEAAAAERDLKQALSDLKQMIAGELGKEIDNFNAKQVELKEKANELKLKIEELEKKKYLTEAQKGELAGLKTDLGEVETAITDTADAHDEATKRILFNILTQRAEIDGLTQAEYDALLLVAEGWGLIDQATADAMGTADAFFRSLDSETELTQAELREIDNIIRGFPSEHNLNFHTTYTSSGKAPPYLDPDAKPGPKQHGGPVKGATPYLVGEKGPEIFMPSQGGDIIPNWKTEQITNNWNMTINEAGRTVDPARSFALMQALAGV